MAKLLKPSKSLSGGEAAENFIHAVYSAIHLFIWARAPKAVDDIREETLADIAYNLVNIHRDSNTKQIWSWCYMIAGRKVAAHYKETAKVRPVVRVEPEEFDRLIENLASAGSSPAELAEARDAADILKNSDQDGFRMLWRYYVEGDELSLLAEEKDKSKGALKMEIQRHRQKAVEILTKANDAPKLKDY